MPVDIGDGKLWIASYGYVGIGTTSPLVRLDVNNGGGSWIAGSFGDEGTGDRVVIGTYSGNAWIGGHTKGLTAWTNLLLNAGGGSVGIGMTNPAQKLHISGITQANAFYTNDGAWYLNDRVAFLNGSTYYVLNRTTGVGVYIQSGQTSWGAQSDERTKRDIIPLDDCLNKIERIKGVFYNYKTDDVGEKRRVGIIAQDVLQALPEVVDIDERTGMYNVRMVEIVPLLISGINELKQVIHTLEERIRILEKSS
jgi:membrane protein implicated in regulation of membrane protease activity